MSQVIVSTDRSKAIPLLQFFFVCMPFMATVSWCIDIVCSSFLLHLVPR